MIKNDSFFLFVFTLIISVLLASCSSLWIDCLYRKNRHLLQAPLSQSHRLRNFFLTFCFLLFGQLFLTRFGYPSFLHFTLQPLPDNFFFSPFLMLLLISAAFLLLTITITDFEQRLIFDSTMLPFSVFGLLFAIFISYTANTFTPLRENLIASIGGGLIFLLLAIVTKGSIGGGDVKLIAALGLWLGPDRLLTVTFTGLFLGGIAAFFLLITGKKKKVDAFAYGPCFTLPALLFVLMNLP